MTLFFIVFLLTLSNILLIIVQTFPTSLILAQSGTKTSIIFPTLTNATPSTHKFLTTITNVTSAISIWDGNGSNAECAKSIQIQHNFTIICLNQQIYAYITAASAYTFQLNGITGSGSNKYSFQSYTIPTQNITCSNHTILLRSSINTSGIGCDKNPAGLLYAITSDECPKCNSNSFFSAQICSCKLCNTILFGCLNCISSLNCINCELHYFLNVTINRCESCHETCLTCSNTKSNNCLSCDTLQHRLLNGTICVCNNTNYEQSKSNYPFCKIINPQWCEFGYFWNSSLSDCRQICGDGLLFYLQCDDGNLIDNDGCSSKCAIQINFTCINGSNVSRSICSYNQSLFLNIINIYKQITNNNLIIEIQISPRLYTFNSIQDFSSFVSTSLAKQNELISAKYINQTLKIIILQRQALQNVVVTIKLNFSNLQNFFAMPTSQIQFKVIPFNNIAAVYYSDSIIKGIQYTIKLINCTQYLGFISLLLGHFSSNVISMQLISIMQTTYLTLVNVKQMNSIEACFLGLKYINGYNNLFNEFNLSFYKSSIKLDRHSRFSILGYRRNMIQNFNYMLILQILAMIILLISYFLLECLQITKLKYQKIFFFINQIIIISFYFNLNNIAFSIGLQLKFIASIDIINLLFILFIFLVFIAYILYFILSSCISGDFMNSFQKNACGKYHSIILCFIRFLINFLNAVLYDYSSVYFVLIVIESLFIIYVIKVKPYPTRDRNLLAIINQVFLIVFISINLSFRSNDSSTDAISEKGSWIIVGFFIFVVIGNYLEMFFFQWTKYFTRNNQDTQSLPKQNIIIQEKNITANNFSKDIQQKVEREKQQQKQSQNKDSMLYIEQNHSALNMVIYLNEEIQDEEPKRKKSDNYKINNE